MAMGLVFWTIMMGFMNGAVFKFCMPRIPQGHLFTAMTVGLFGSVLFGWLGASLGLYEYGDPRGLAASFAGSLICLYVFYIYIAAHDLKDMRNRPKFRHHHHHPR